MLKDELLSRYGPTMTIPDLAEVFHISRGCIYNKLSKQTFEITVFKLGGKLVADTNDVADYIQNMKMLNQVSTQ
jgi:predicted DNA-binding transcriptional regulator AlpA